MKSSEAHCNGSFNLSSSVPFDEAKVTTLKGIYVLILQIDGEITVNVGALGKLVFTKGLYGYVGSAQGNLEKRVQRHLRKEKRRFWHIDYLLGNSKTRILQVFTKQGDKNEECAVAEAIALRGSGIDGFGASDCNCKSHLFRIEDYSFLQKSMRTFDLQT